jgi:hypothetical protein
MPIQLPGAVELQNYEVAEPIDFDGGIVTVPATGVQTMIQTFSPQNYFWLESVIVGVYDPGAINLMTWSIVIDGIPFGPWGTPQRLLPGQYQYTAYIGRLIYTYRKIDVRAGIPSTSPVGFDTVGRITGALLRWRGFAQS